MERLFRIPSGWQQDDRDHFLSGRAVLFRRLFIARDNVRHFEFLSTVRFPVHCSHAGRVLLSTSMRPLGSSEFNVDQLHDLLDGVFDNLGVRMSDDDITVAFVAV